MLEEGVYVESRIVYYLLLFQPLNVRRQDLCVGLYYLVAWLGFCGGKLKEYSSVWPQIEYLFNLLEDSLNAVLNRVCKEVMQK